MPLTAAALYDHVRCPHRVFLDAAGDPGKQDPESAFLKLLWERGNAFERAVMDRLEQPYLDLSPYKEDEKARRTLAAMAAGAPLIYSARIASDDLLGDPDLLRLTGGGYEAGDIKSGAGRVGGDEGRLKEAYAMQLALYTDILERLGYSAGRRAFVWDIHGEEVAYDLTAPMGKRGGETWWDRYQTRSGELRAILAMQHGTRPGACSHCKLCHWHSLCWHELKTSGDLTLVSGLGPAKRDAMCDQLPTIYALAGSDPARFVRAGRTAFTGVGPGSLARFHARARLLTESGARPYRTGDYALPRPALEVFFDIEVDPMREACYLHGFVERDAGGAGRYVHFFADDPAREREVFARALDYVRGLRDYTLYYYSRYERTWWRRLQQRYPDVVGPDEIERLFAAATDLYSDVIDGRTEWPTHSYGIKDIARYLGFRWRDQHPSGMESIEWYHRYVETGDARLKDRILAYNEDDCRAMGVVLDGLRSLPPGP